MIYKEAIQMQLSLLLYIRYTMLIVIALVELVIRWLDTFSSSNVLSYTISPETIVLGKHNPNINQKIITLVYFSMVYIGTNNTMKRRIVPSVVLNELNEWGGNNFMSLYLGKNIHSH